MVEKNINLNFPGIRLYVEDPQAAIRRQIKRTVYVALAVIILGSIFLFWAVKAIKKDAESLASKEKLINSSLAEQGIQPTTETYETVLPYADQINNALPSATDLLGYQGKLEEAAKAAGVQISIIFSSQASKTASVDHNVEVKGQPENIIQFIKNLENLPYFVQLANFKISSPQGQGQDSSATLSLKIFTSK